MRKHGSSLSYIDDGATIRNYNKPQYVGRLRDELYTKCMVAMGNAVAMCYRCCLQFPLCIIQVIYVILYSTSKKYAQHLVLLMMTSSNGNTFRATGPFVRGIHRSPVSSPHKGQWHGALMFSLICLNKRLSKQSWGWWFETPSCPLWRHCNVLFTTKLFKTTSLTHLSQMPHICVTELDRHWFR